MIELAPDHKHGLSLPRPVMNAAGVLGFAGEARGLVDLAALGAFITNPVTWSPRTPAAPPNVLERPGGLWLHTGLPNPGLREVLRRHAPEWWRDFGRRGIPVIVHVAAASVSEAGRCRAWLEREERVSALELGLREDVTVEALTALIHAARGGPPLLVRLPAGRAVELAEAAIRAGADALTVTAPARLTLDADGRTVTGRVYGPDQLAATLAAVQSVAQLEVDGRRAPIVGAGGIFTVEDARAVLAAGATAVQIDAALWRDPEWLRAWAAEGPSPI